jgi:hypothetical protein
MLHALHTSISFICSLLSPFFLSFFFFLPVFFSFLSFKSNLSVWRLLCSVLIGLMECSALHEWDLFRHWQFSHLKRLAAVIQLRTFTSSPALAAAASPSAPALLSPTDPNHHTPNPNAQSEDTSFSAVLSDPSTSSTAVPTGRGCLCHLFSALPTGVIIYRQHSPADALYLVRSGQMALTLCRTPKRSAYPPLISGQSYSTPPLLLLFCVCCSVVMLLYLCFYFLSPFLNSISFLCCAQ